jgi:hypothetical protein
MLVVSTIAWTFDPSTPPLLSLVSAAASSRPPVPVIGAVAARVDHALVVEHGHRDAADLRRRPR